MGNTAVRRQLLLEYLLDCQHTTAGELNCAFQMCSRTIQRAVGREFDRRGQHPTVAMTGGRNDDTIYIFCHRGLFSYCPYNLGQFRRSGGPKKIFFLMGKTYG